MSNESDTNREALGGRHPTRTGPTTLTTQRPPEKRKLTSIFTTIITTITKTLKTTLFLSRLEKTHALYLYACGDLIFQ